MQNTETPAQQEEEKTSQHEVRQETKDSERKTTEAEPPTTAALNVEALLQEGIYYLNCGLTTRYENWKQDLGRYMHDVEGIAKKRGINP